MENSEDSDGGVKGDLGRVSRKESDVTRRVLLLVKLLSEEERRRLQIRQTSPVLKVGDGIPVFRNCTSQGLVCNSDSSLRSSEMPPLAFNI